MDLENKQALIYGAGKSGISAARLLLKEGAVPTIFDGNTSLDVDAIREQVGADIRILLGEMTAAYGEFDLLIMSPGISCENPVFEEFSSRGLPIWGEVELACRAGRGKILAVTGTNGKTTTVSLLGKILSDHLPEVYTVGNIGMPYTDVAMQQTDAAWTVAEVSSFQLETIEKFHPCACAITNITEDHLNRHHTMEAYIAAKERIAENQTAEDFCVLNAEDEALRDFAGRVASHVVFFSSERELEEGLFIKDGTIFLAEKTGASGEAASGAERGLIPVVRTEELQILGKHNHENVMTAVALAYYGAGLTIGQIRESVLAFSGVEHRIEFVEEIGGVRYYNDSKGTNPDAAIQAIRAMDRPTLLIGGGYDKESSYEEWIEAFEGKVKLFALIGQTREKIRDAAIACGFPEERIVLCEDLHEAVELCAGRAQSGDAVLLSPACASWGQFDNFEQRGDLFKEYVRERK